MTTAATAVPQLLADKRLLITGVVTRDSIAFAVAEQAQLAGAEVILTGFGRARRLTERVAKRLPTMPEVLELDVNRQEDLDALKQSLAERWPAVDGVLHAIAYAPADAIGGNFLATPIESARTAFETSAYSLKALAVAVRPLLSEQAAIVGLDFDATIAWPSYDWMGVAKAALEATGRYLARDLGPDGTRVNLVSAGPLRTAAASGIEGFSDLIGHWQSQAPLGWDADSALAVARTVCFLLSDWASGITGEIVHVDGGYHAIGASLPPASH